MAKPKKHTTTSKSTKKPVKQPLPAAPNKELRTKKHRSYKSFRLQKRIKNNAIKVPGSFRILKRAFRVIWSNKWRFFFTTLIYGLITVALVMSARSSLNVSQVKSSIQDVLAGSWSGVAASVLVVGFMLGSTTSTAGSELGGVYQVILVLIGSLAFIWLMRHAYANRLQKFRARDAFYKGMEPLIRVILVFVVLLIQIIPGWIGMNIYNIASSTGTIANIAEQVLLIIFAASMALLTMYMLTSSLFALYIVTLPDMTPLKALRSARKLVLHRRWTVMRKVLFIPLGVVLCSILLLVPFILWLPRVAEPVFYAYSIMLLPITHAYMYILYRELLREKN